MNAGIISIPVHNNRVSPLFDVAGRFVVIDTKSPAARRYLDTAGLSGISILDALNDAGVNTVVCSAISLVYAQAILGRNMKLVYGIIGPVDEIVNACIENTIESSRFAMPGCRRRKRMMGQCPFSKQQQ